MNKIYISHGNIKVKANVFNLPSIQTCATKLLCHHFCYSRKAERQYPAVLPSRKLNLEASKQKDFTEEIIKILKTRKNKVVRIHESGDFYVKKYVLKWYQIMKLLPSYVFYAYTKQFDIFTPDVIKKKPSNFTLIASMEEDKGDYPEDNTKQYLAKGFDKVSYISAKDTNCDSQIDKEIKCCVGCNKCYDKDTDEIIFKKH